MCVLEVHVHSVQAIRVRSCICLLVSLFQS